MKQLPKYRRVEEATGNYSGSWRSVNTDNEFEVEGKTFVIAQSVKAYEVFKKPELIGGKYNDWKNSAGMDLILVVFAKEGYRFYDQNVNEIDKELIREKGVSKQDE